MKKSEILALAKAGAASTASRKAPVVDTGVSFNGDRNDMAPVGGPMAHQLTVMKGANDNRSQQILEFQKQSDCLYLLNKMTGIPIQKMQSYGRFQRFVEESELKKAMTDSTQANWVPTQMSAEFYNLIQLALKVAPLFGEVVMPRSPFQIPRKSSFSLATLKTEASAATESTVGAGKMTLTAQTIVDFLQVSYELDEDAAFAVAPMVRDDAVNAIARGIDNAIINGDTTGSHMDSDVTLAYDVRKAWKGLRKHCLANSYKTDINTFNADTVLGLRASMAKYGAAYEQLAYILGPKVNVKMVNLKDSANNRIYLELGTPGAPMANMVPGQVGQLSGSPVIVSEFAREDLSTTGVYDGSSTVRGTLMVVRRDAWTKGVVRRVMVETFRDIVAQVNKLVVSTRMDFQPKYDITTEPIAWLGYNIA
jgi:HK97 family phage major capsid protein